MNQGMPSSLRSLDDFSVSQLPSPEHESVFPELSLEDLDQILSCDFSREPVDDDFAFTDLTLTNVQPIAQKLPPINSLLSFSQPSSRPVAIVGPLNKDTHEQVATETTEFNVPESSGSGEPLPLTLSVAHQQTDEKKASLALEKRRAVQKARRESEKGKAYHESGKSQAAKAQYAASEKRKAAKRKYNAQYAASEKGKAARAKYDASEKGKAVKARCDAKYAASVKGKVAKAKYAASVKGKAVKAKCDAQYLASVKGKMVKAKCDAKYAASVKGKVANAIRSAKSNAYKSAIKKGFSEKEARKKGESAANAKKAELLSMDRCPYT